MSFSHEAADSTSEVDIIGIVVDTGTFAVQVGNRLKLPANHECLAVNIKPDGSSYALIFDKATTDGLILYEIDFMNLVYKSRQALIPVPMIK